MIENRVACSRPGRCKTGAEPGRVWAEARLDAGSESAWGHVDHLSINLAISQGDWRIKEMWHCEVPTGCKSMAGVNRKPSWHRTEVLQRQMFIVWTVHGNGETAIHEKVKRYTWEPFVMSWILFQCWHNTGQSVTSDDHNVVCRKISQ